MSSAIRGADPLTPGRVLVLAGVYNTRFHLVRFGDTLKFRLPGFQVAIRSWGIPLLSLYNLSAYRRNLEKAKRFADELAECRQRFSDRPLCLVGHSGRGGLAILTVAALPEAVSVDRLVLVAPAISPAYPLREALLPHVSEFVANFASEKDLQVN